MPSSAWKPPAGVSAAQAAMAGHYAHYDIVAYEAPVPGGTMRTFIITYGFTDLRVEGNKLVEYDRFCHASHKVNQDVVTAFDDAATQAIVPRSTPVDVFQEDGVWKLYRPATPTLIGVHGDPAVPLPKDAKLVRAHDADNDGKPGVTVRMKIGHVLNGELYIARREIFQYDLTLHANGQLLGHVIDDSEQLVLGGAPGFLATQTAPVQAADAGLSPIMLLPIASSVDSCEKLMAQRDALFPAEPMFH